MLKKSIGLIFTILFACHGIGSAHEGGSGKVGDSEVRLFSNSPRLNGNVQEVRTSDPGTNKSQKPSGLELNAALEYSNSPSDFYDPTFRNEPFKGLLAANQTMRILSNSSGGSANQTDSKNLVEISELRPSPLFITEAMKKGPNRIPESSTLMLLGLVLVGLAGYGGRKKFKR